MKHWWEIWPGRLEAELEAFSRRGLSFERDEEAWAAGRLVLRGRAPLDDGETAPLVVVYPDTFPETRFVIYAPALALPRHQAPFGGSLCVMPRDSDHWRPSYLAADWVHSEVPRLVRLVRGTPDALRAQEDPQGEPITTYYPYWPAGAIVVPGASLSLPRDVAGGTFKLRHGHLPDWLKPMLAGMDCTGAPPGKALLTEVHGRDGVVLAEAESALASRFVGQVWRGTWRRLPSAPTGKSEKELFEQLDALFPRLAVHPLGAGRAELAAVVFPEEVRQGEYEDAWLFYLRVKGERARFQTHWLLRALRFGPEDLGSRIPELAPLRERTVSLVGLGTLGAPLAHELARAQVNRLRIADPDFVDPATGGRWITELEFAGAPKVRALEALLWRNYPYTAVETFPVRVGDAPLQVARGQGEAAQLAALVSGTHLLIDATAEENVSRALAAQAQAQGIPQLFVWSVDGLGGVVARVVPGRTGCYYCLLLGLSDGRIPLPPHSPDAAKRRVQPRGCASPTFTASAVELTPLVAQAAQLAFSTLCDGEAGGYPASANDVFVLALRTPDGALLPVPQWSGARLLPHPECPSCSTRAVLP